MVVDARVAAGVVQQHQREQAQHLGVVGHQPAQQPAEADRLAAQLAAHQPVALAGRVALVEDQVDDAQHAAQAVGQLLVGGHAVGDVRVGDLALRAHEPLAHRRLGDEERARDLARRQAAQRAQRERHARRQIQRRMAAGEDQPQPVVDDRARLAHRRDAPAESRRASSASRSARSASERSRRRRSIARRRAATVIHAPGFAGHPVARPRRDRRLERVLHRILGELEVADMADQRGQHGRALVAKRRATAAAAGSPIPAAARRERSRLSGRRLVGATSSLTSMTGRTSTDP